MKSKNSNKAHPSAVDSSYTLFFILTSAGLSLLLASTNNQWGALFGFSVFCFVAQDIIQQVFDPIEAMVTYFWTFIIFPGIMTLSLNNVYILSAAAVFVAAHITAGILEVIYNRLIGIKQLAPLRKILLGIDSRTDTSLIEVGAKHFLLTSYRGITFVFLMSVLYFTVTFLLFKN